MTSAGRPILGVDLKVVDLMDRVIRQEDVVAKGYAEGLSAYQVLIIASMVL